jgi:hydroxymethylpyrimidine pyrophosphatase-like HAD family hydrolase
MEQVRITDTRSPDAMLVFDLDGVVTDLETGNFNPEVLDAIADDLAKGLPVAFISGRPLEWADEHVVDKLASKCGPDELSRLLVVAEKGGVTAFIEDGERKVSVDGEALPPPAFSNEAKDMLSEDRGGWSFADTMFWDEAKRTMATIEKKPGISQSDFAAARSQMVPYLRAIVESHGMDDFIIDTTTIGTDIEHVTASKRKGAQAVLKWLERHGIKPQAFDVFGDSPSDGAMAEVFGETADTKFIYVGDPAKLGEVAVKPYATIVTGGGYDTDAAKYLKNV